MSSSFIMIEVCQKMGWDYFTYQKQPFKFIQLIYIKNQLDKLTNQ